MMGREMGWRRGGCAVLIAMASLGCSDDSQSSQSTQSSASQSTAEGGGEERFVKGSELPSDFQESLEVSIEATAELDPDAYWTIIVDACKQYHGSAEDWASYFLAEQSSIDAVLRVSGGAYGVSDMKLDLDQTRVRFDDPDRAWVQYGVVHATDGNLLVETEDAEPIRWLREGGQWRTTFCTFGGPPPVDDEGRLVVGEDLPSSTIEGLPTSTIE